VYDVHWDHWDWVSIEKNTTKEHINHTTYHKRANICMNAPQAEVALFTDNEGLSNFAVHCGLQNVTIVQAYIHNVR